MTNTWKWTLVVSVGICLSAYSADAQSKHLFHIPVYPGTTPFHTMFTSPEEINLPFVTSLRVYRTVDGSSLNADSVISFYESLFRSKGWKEGIDKRTPPEPYAAFRIDVFEHLDDHTHIQLAGDIAIWIAPRDGMITVFCKQWRISSPNQETTNLLSKLSKTLSNLAAGLHYEISEVYSSSQWPEYYENEYLLECSGFTLSDPRIARPTDTYMDGLIQTTTLVYRDSAVARAEGERLRAHWNDNVGVVDSSLGPNAFLIKIGDEENNGLIQFNKVLLVLSDLTGRQRGQVVTLLEKLQREMH